jgi:hypothetical protein
MSTLADALIGEGEYSEAEQLLRQALDLLRPRQLRQGLEERETLSGSGEGVPETAKWPDSSRNRQQQVWTGLHSAREARQDEAFTNPQFAVEHALNPDTRQGLGHDADLSCCTATRVSIHS